MVVGFPYLSLEQKSIKFSIYVIGISLYDCLSNTPLLSSSLSLIAKVLLLKPFRVFLIKYMFEIMAKNIILFIYLFASKNT
jgi:hypothetical protein